MGNFYVQDNPRANLVRREINDSIQLNDRRQIANMTEESSIKLNPDTMETIYARKAEIAKRKSTMTPTQKARARVIKQQRRRQEMNERLAALGLACIVVGGIATSVISSVADMIEEHVAIYSQLSDFRKEVIEPNTHRTNDGNGFYYDYDDIADAIFAEGKDSSIELYKAYSALGKKYTNDLLEEANYSSLESFVRRCGYDSIRDWERYSNEAVLVEAQISEKQAELNAMHDDYVGNNNSAILSAQMNGGSK